MRKIILSLFLCCILIIPVAITLVRATPILTLTANTDSSLYNRYTTVTLIGSMAYNNYENIQYPSDSLVGFEVQDPTGNTTIIRTIQTGSSVPFSQPAYVSAAYLCNTGGNQITSIPIPNGVNQVIPSLYVAVNNNLNSAQTILITFNLFDSNGVPISVAHQQISADALASSSAIVPFQIPSWAHYGSAYAYVDVYSDWPSHGGIPLGLEKAFQFTITGGTPFSGTPPTTNSFNGIYQYYNFSYRLPKNTAIGTYTAYSTANYLGIPGEKSTTFQVAQLGDLTSDGAVNFRDISLFVGDYVAYYTSHTYTQAIDFNGDGKINYQDIQLFVKYYIYYWSS